MAKDFDIFLHRHLTECDLFIQSIPFRDGISVTDRMILDACLQGCKLLRIAAAQSSMELVAQIDRLIKTCCERLGTSVVMDATAELKALSIMRPATEPIEISAENIGTLTTVLNRVEADMVMSVEPIVTKIKKSPGRMDTTIVSDASVTGDLKKSILALRSSTILNAGLDGDLKTALLLDVNTGMSMDVTLDSLCTRIGFDAIAGIEMAAMILGTRLSHSLGRVISGITIDSKVIGTKSRKIEAANGIIQIMADMVPILIKIIYPEDSNIFIDADVSGSSLKRYRLLEDMDDFALEEFDDMTFDEVDYVILAE